MATIKIMSTMLANKIAAGEVVERPASVVKELIENAIDAGANKIDIYLEEAGLKMIKIIDNGSGMDREDALLAFSRHATSKLLDESDLFRIHTLGFRGEALPSIASVSDMTLLTSTGNEGTLVHYRGGKLVEESYAKSRKGTEVTVQNLFFNTPARLKYLKSINTELGYTSDYVNKFALANPHIAFKFVSDGRTLLQSSGSGDVLSIIGTIYGLDVAKKMHRATYQDQLLNLNLYFAEPEIYRTSRNYITLMVNQRVVKNYELTRAVIEGYEGYLPISRYPVVVIDLKVDPLLVDVNVHPAKLEVRFSNLEYIQSVITDLIKKQLKEIQVIPKVSLREHLRVEKPFVEQQQFTLIDQQNVDELFQKEDNLAIEEKTLPAVIAETKPIYEVKQEEVILPVQEETPQVQSNTAQEVIEQVLPRLYYIGQLGGTYLLTQNEFGLYIVDQHAAEERVNFEYYLDQLTKDTTEVYELLIPLTFEFSLNEALIIEKHMDQFSSLKIKIEKFGLKSFIVTEVPNWLNQEQVQHNLEYLFKQVLQDKPLSKEALFHDLAATLSCKRSIKANHYIDEREVNALLAKLVRCRDPYRCPHGRPVIIHISYQEIEQMFKRIV